MRKWITRAIKPIEHDLRAWLAEFSCVQANDVLGLKPVA
jgi:hypothetical protein